MAARKFVELQRDCSAGKAGAVVELPNAEASAVIRSGDAKLSDHDAFVGRRHESAPATPVKRASKKRRASVAEE